MSRLSTANQNRRIIAVHSKLVLALIVCALTCVQGFPQADQTKSAAVHARSPKLLTKKEGSSVVAVARDSQSIRRGRTDCSHLVHAIYQHAGFPYPYADSKDLYVGTESFVPVTHPQAGGLVVWRGHVGIVLSPIHHTFLSALSHGPGTDKYNARYWKRRGTPRFYRYLKPTPSRATVQSE